MTYQDRLNEHLAEYKRATLGLHEKGVYLHRGKRHFYDHILPTEAAWFNLLDQFRRPMQTFFASNPRIKRHRYFHHLNSSQAFAFNLFFPYFQNGSVAARVLLRALGQDGSFQKWEPESIPVEEEETNVDVVWETTDGVKTFCEVKLSEADFGSAKADLEHLEKLKRLYGTSLAGSVDADLLTPARFFSSYQILRNVWQLTRAPNSLLIFLMPRANQRLWNQLEQVLSGISIEMIARISALAIEDVIATLCADDSSPPLLAGYAQQLRLKYVLPESN